MATNFYLVNLNDGIELRDTDDGQQMRHHWILTRKQKMHARDTFSSDVGKTSGVLSYSVGSVTKTKTMPASRKYLCVDDGIEPEADAAEVIIRTQVWEHYTPWVDMPDLGGP